MNDFRANHHAVEDQREQRCWGMLAQFAAADDLLRAARTMDQEGYTSLEAFTPFPVEGLDEVISAKRSPMPMIIFIGGLVGGTSIYALEYWVNLFAYPINIGGRPLHSWPSFIPPTFEGTVLGASLAAIIGVVLVCRLPRLHHPVFEVEAFRRASTDGFFLAVKSDAENFDRDQLRALLQEIGAAEVWEVSDG